ncbi:O-antigen polymerase, partial [Lacticaseibacillus paracasei subsp. paracasei Lpp70]
MENIREGSRAGSVITEYYLYILFVFLILRSINYYSLIPSVFDSIVFALLAVAGGAMIAWNCLDFLRHKSFVSYDWWLIGFLIVMFISSLLNRHYGVSGNFKTIVWSAIYFFLI